MVDREHWNWDTGKKLVSDLRAVEGRFDQVHEWVVSDDGERIAAPVLTGPEVFRVWVNDSLWDGEFEKAWNFVFAPDGRLTALVRIDIRNEGRLACAAQGLVLIRDPKPR